MTPGGDTPAALEVERKEGDAEAARAWVEAFGRERGRAPRVLHIGNIAGNAYNNAKLMNAAGLACDVVVLDYYHIMGYPEWEDADFSDDVGDHFRPDWTCVDLRGFERPRWFVQGPPPLCLDYLQARQAGDRVRTERAWRMLGYANRTLPAPPEHRLAARRAALAGEARRWLRAAVTPETVARRLRDLAHRLQTGGAPGGRAAGALVRAARPLATACSHAALRAWQLVPRDAPEARRAALVAAFEAAFPDRLDRLEPLDLQPFEQYLGRWRRVLAGYDVVQGYAVDPVIPMLAGVPYFAFEHGTLRELPFTASATGRLTALAYHLAEHVFVSNSDCMQNARRLAGTRVSALPHPFDESRTERISGWEPVRAQYLARLQSDHLVFFPTRQDWVPGAGYADKANDVFLRAVAALRREGVRVGVVCCRWGRNVAESERLAAELGIAAHVAWVEPMGVVPFERLVKAADVVADQFLLGAFGGVTFRALAAGTPVCTYLDEDQVAASFGASPPILNCRTEEQIRAQLGRALRTPGALERIARDARAWVRAHHAGAATMARQVARYARSVRMRAAAGGG